jgi:hypothetical protein
VPAIDNLVFRCIRMMGTRAHPPCLPVGLQPTDLDPWHPDMLRAKSEPNQPGRQSLQHRILREQAHRQRRRQFFFALEDAADDPVLHEDLYRLHRPGGEFPAALNGVEIVVGDPIPPCKKAGARMLAAATAS